VKYVPRHVVIEAFRLGYDPLPKWFMEKVNSEDAILHFKDRDLCSCSIWTLEGKMMASVGAFIIRGLKGEIYPCSRDIFHMKYQPQYPCTMCRGTREIELNGEPVPCEYCLETGCEPELDKPLPTVNDITGSDPDFNPNGYTQPQEPKP